MSEEERELSANSSIGALQPSCCCCNEHPQTQQGQECTPPACPPAPPLLCSPVLPIPHPLLCFPKLQEQLSCHLGGNDVPKGKCKGKGWCSLWHSRDMVCLESIPLSLVMGGIPAFFSTTNSMQTQRETQLSLSLETWLCEPRNTDRKGMKAPRSSSDSDKGI